MKLNRVVFSKLEYEWLAANVSRTKVILEKASQADPKIKERVTYKILAAVESLFVIATGDPREKFEVMLSRKQKQSLGNLVMTTMLILRDRIIPAYKERISQNPANDLTPYLEDVKIKVSILKELHKKLQ